MDWVGGNGAKGAGGRSSPNRASWTTGLAARLGGEPQKNGELESERSSSPPFARSKSTRSSSTALESGKPSERHRNGSTGSATTTASGMSRRGLGQKVGALWSVARKRDLVSSEAA